MEENFELAKPLGDRVLVSIESKEKTIGGIIIPDSVKTGDNKIAVVVSTGDGVYTHS
jgi:co-chaperonin GroES (HSP10)